MTDKRPNIERAWNGMVKPWAKIASITDRSLRFGFRPLGALLMMLDISEGQDRYKITSKALETEPAKRIKQIHKAWMASASTRTIPVGVLFVGKAIDDTINGLDEVALVRDAVEFAAKLSDVEAQELTGALFDYGAVLASQLLPTLGIGADGGEDLITDVP